MRWEIFTAAALGLAGLCSCSALYSSTPVDGAHAATPVIATELSTVESQESIYCTKSADELCGVPADGSRDTAYAAIGSALVDIGSGANTLAVDDLAFEIYEDPQPLVELSIDFEAWLDAQRPIVVAIGPRTAAWRDPTVYAAAQAFRCVAVDAADAAKWGVTSPAIVVCDFRWNILAKLEAPTDVAGCLAVLEKGESLRDQPRTLAATSRASSGSRCANGSCTTGTCARGSGGACTTGNCATGNCATGQCSRSRGLFGR